MDAKKFYAVTCKCGHAGSRNFYCQKTFPVQAESGKEAAQIARFIPRVKHHHKDCVLSVEEIGYDEFLLLRKANDNDPFLHCSSIQEQRELCPDLEIFREEEHVVRKESESAKGCYRGKERIRRPLRYLRMNPEREVIYE